MKLALYTKSLGTANVTIADGSYNLTFDDAVLAVTLNGIANATPAVAAESIATAINGSDFAVNGYHIRATSASDIVAIMGVENATDGSPHGIQFNVGSADAWNATTIQTPLVDATAGYVKQQDVTNQLLAAVAAGALVSRAVGKKG